MYHVDFLNKNTLRNYPFRSNIRVVTDGGLDVPTAFLSSAQFSITTGYEQVFINRFFIKDNHINLLVGAMVGSALRYIGYFDGIITEDYQRIVMASLIPSAFGAITVGRRTILDELQGYHSLSVDTGRIEDSLVTHVPVPTVTSISHDGSRLTGRINLEYTNIQQIVDTAKLQLAVINRSAVRALNDVNSSFNNCETYAIGSINGVTPNSLGNIDIYGISPVEVSILGNGGITLDVPTISRTELCAGTKQIPPLIEISRYLQFVQTAVDPEWKSWPQNK